MKRIITIFVIFALISTVFTVVAESENSGIAFECGLTSSVVPDTALEIIESDTQRALITVCLWIDFGLCDDGKDFMANNLA